MIRSLAVVPLLFLLFMATMAVGQEAAPIMLSLDEALNMAMESSPQIQSLRASTQAQESYAQSEENRWLGELMLNGGVAMVGDDTLIRPINSDLMSGGMSTLPFDERYAFWSFAYRMPIYTGGSVSGSRDAARLTAEASRGSMSHAVLGIRHQVLKTYVDLLSVDARIVAWQDELNALNSLVSHIELGQEAGKYSRVDLLKTQVQQQNVMTMTHSLQLQRTTGYATLMALMGEKTGSDPQYELMPMAEPTSAQPLLMTDALVDSAMVRRSDLRALRDLAAAQRFNASAISGSRLPQVSVGGNFSGTHGGTIDFDDTFWSVNATVSVPLLDMGRRKNLSQKADLSAQSAALKVADMEGRIRAEVIAAQSAYVNSQNNIEIQLSTLELASEISRLETLRYDSGRGDIDNLLKSLASERVAEAALMQANHNLLITWNNLQLTIEGECR